MKPRARCTVPAARSVETASWPAPDTDGSGYRGSSRNLKIRVAGDVGGGRVSAPAKCNSLLLPLGVRRGLHRHFRPAHHPFPSLRRCDALTLPVGFLVLPCSPRKRGHATPGEANFSRQNARRPIGRRAMGRQITCNLRSGFVAAAAAKIVPSRSVLWKEQ